MYCKYCVLVFTHLEKMVAQKESCGHWFKKKDPEKHNSAHKCVYNVATHKGNFLI